MAREESTTVASTEQIPNYRQPQHLEEQPRPRSGVGDLDQFMQLMQDPQNHAAAPEGEVTESSESGLLSGSSRSQNRHSSQQSR